jgi:hypothetical protein
MQNLNRKVSIVYRVYQSFPRKRVWLPPKGEPTLAAGGWAAGTQIIRLYKNSDILYILLSLYGLKNNFKH